MAGYGPSRGGVRVIGGFWVYAAVNRRHTSSGDLASLMTACEDEELRGARQGDGSAAHQRDGRTVDDPDLKDGLPEKSGNGCPVTVVRENNRFPREPDLDDRRRSRLKLPHCRQLPDAPLIGAAGMKPYRLLAHETFPLRLTAKPVSAITPLPNNGRAAGSGTGETSGVIGVTVISVIELLKARATYIAGAGATKDQLEEIVADE